jgi:hypothetical protein
MLPKFGRFILSAALILICLFARLASGIEVSGDVSGTWGPEDNPYLVIGDLRVPPSQSLIIQPGCQIQFRGHYKFTVDSLAILRALGDEADSIIFTDEDTLTGWNGIRFRWADSSCQIAFCRLEWGRGASYNQYPDFTRCLGGAIYLLRSGLSVRNSNIRFNRAWEGLGGAIYAENSDLGISQSVLEHNRSGMGGSAIYAKYSNVLIEKNIISKDTTFYALGGETGGGAVGCIYSSVEIRSNIITDNFCGMNGGGLLVNANIPTNSFRSVIIDNLIANNECLNYGGGAYVGGVSLISYNLIYNNRTVVLGPSAGGGIACRDSTTLANNTIVFNYCYNIGGGVYYWGQTIANTFENNIIWGNIANADSQMYFADQTPIIIYNDIQGGFSGQGNIDSDPLFAGPDDFHLSWLNYPIEDSTKSPCIDAGDPISPPDSDGTRADMGAFPFDRRIYGIDDNSRLPIGDYILIQNYPNPFNPTTIIAFTLPHGATLKAEVFNIMGEEVQTIRQEYFGPGEHFLVWNGLDDYGKAQASGLYFFRLSGEKISGTSKMTLIR